MPRMGDLSGHDFINVGEAGAAGVEKRLFITGLHDVFFPRPEREDHREGGECSPFRA